MSRRDFIPRNDAEFNNWFKNLTQYVTAKLSGASPAWDHIPQRHAFELVEALNAWAAAYAPTVGPHTPAQAAAKNDARRRAEGVIRPFVRRFLHFEPVTHADRVNMVLPQHDAIRTDHFVVPEEVEFNLLIEGIRVVHVDFKVLGADHKAKPEGYDGAVVVYQVAPTGDPALERPEDFTEHEMASRTPHTLQFDALERGQTVWVALCWQNERGIRGRWSDVKSAVVP